MTSCSSSWSTWLIVGRSSGFASVHVTAISRIASTVSISASVHLLSTTSSNRFSLNRVFICTCSSKTQKLYLEYSETMGNHYFSTELKQIIILRNNIIAKKVWGAYPANNIQAPLYKSWISWPFSSYKLQQENSKAVDIRLFCGSTTLQIFCSIVISNTKSIISICWK